MRARAILLAVVAGLVLVGSGPCQRAVRAATTADRIWFTPDPGSLDYQRLFDHPDEWPRARQDIQVFKFYQQHTVEPPPAIVGPNSYDALVRVGAFRLLREWNIRTAIEVASVKEFYCTPDASGIDASIDAAVRSVRAVKAAGGTVAYLAMDEPWVSGRSRRCGGPALEPTADRVAAWIAGVHGAAPDVAIGLIEAYPFSSADAIERMLQLLADRGAPPAFLHVDADWRLLGPGDFARGLRRLQAVCAARQIPFGVIVFGYNGDADALYAADAAHVVDLIADAFQRWDDMPDHLIFQSWAVSSTGLLITPSNLPESGRYTHTDLVFQFTRRLRGTIGASIGRAVPR